MYVLHTGLAARAPYPNPSSAWPMALPKPESPAVTPGFFFGDFFASWVAYMSLSMAVRVCKTVARTRRAVDRCSLFEMRLSGRVC